MKRGLFLVFEGIDGVGKTTQAIMATGRLRWEGYDVLYVRDPGSTPLGEAVRRLLKEHEISPVAQVLLFAAARAELALRIRNALKEGQIVLCDRWIYSSLAYQGLYVDEEFIWAVNKPVFDLVPDAVFVFDDLLQTAMARAKKRPFEELQEKSLEIYKEMVVLSQIQARYSKISPPNGEKLIWIWAEGSKEEVQDRLWGHIQALLEKTK